MWKNLGLWTATWNIDMVVWIWFHRDLGTFSGLWLYVRPHFLNHNQTTRRICNIFKICLPLIYTILKKQISKDFFPHSLLKFFNIHHRVLIKRHLFNVAWKWQQAEFWDGRGVGGVPNLVFMDMSAAVCLWIVGTIFCIWKLPLDDSL